MFLMIHFISIFTVKAGTLKLSLYLHLKSDIKYLIFVGENRPVMDWAMRVKIAIGAARGIAYLHEDCKYLVLICDSNF